MPTVESIRNYVGHTPKTLQSDPIFQKVFGRYLNDLKDQDLVLECHWPGNVIEIYTMLLCHAFHCPSVQCCFISDWQLGKGEVGREGLAEMFFELSPEIKTVLAIGFTEQHYAVIKVDLVEKNSTGLGCCS